jgi:integrase
MQVKSFKFAELAEFVARTRAATDTGFRGQIKFWIDRFGDRDIREISVDDVEDAVDELRRRPKCRPYYNPATGERRTIVTDQPLSNSTVNKFINSLGSVWRECHAQGYLRKKFQSPTKGFGRLSEATGKVVDASAADVQRLVSAARLTRNRKLAGYIAFACTTGWRRGNIESVTWADLDLKAGRAKAGKTKNGTPHWIPLLPFVVAELEKMRPEQAGDGDLVFGTGNIRRSYTSALRLADLPETWTVHTMRHVAASVLTQSGAPIQTVAAALNHKTLSMAMRYSHQNLEQLRDSVRRAWK